MQSIAREDGLSQDEACRRFVVDPSRITRIAQSLEGEELAWRECGPNDKCVVQLHLTEKGHDFVKKFPERHEGFEQRVASTLSDEEALELRRLLDKLTDVMRH